MIKINTDWQGKKGLENLIRYIENNLVYGEAQEQVRIVAHHAADNMQQTIKESGYNLDALANKILAETLTTTGGIEVGIGRISSLPFYWQMFDAGFKPGTTNKLVPAGAFDSNGKWVVGNGDYTFLDKKSPKKSVESLDYIGKAIRNLDKELKETIERLGSKFINGATQASK